MTKDAGCEIAAMRQMTASQLRIRFLQVFGDPPRTLHKQHLIRRIAWRLQAQQEGNLSERARRRAVELAREADLRLGPPRKANAKPAVSATARSITQDKRLPMPGTILVRQYAGRTIQVQVLQRGFEHDGQIYKSLTAVAKRITGKHWNGYHFFGLNKQGATI